MRFLLTGASGFLGKHIKDELGECITLARQGDVSIHCDLAHAVPILPAVDVVVHAAGKAHVVPKNSSEEKDFFEVNALGTQNLLKGLEASGKLPSAFIFISSVAVYGIESGTNIDEETPLLAIDAYGKSKIEAERLLQKWCAENQVTLTILRLPLIGGLNPPGNLASMIKAIKKGYYFNVGSGGAKKSIVLAQDVAKLVPKVAAIGGIYNLTDGEHPTFSALSSCIAQQLGKKKPASLPLWMVKLLAIIGNQLGDKAPLNSMKLNKIVSNLTFCDKRARQILGWNPTPARIGLKVNL